MRHCWRLNCWLLGFHGILRILAVPSHEPATRGSWTRMSVGLHSVLAKTSWWVNAYIVSLFPFRSLTEYKRITYRNSTGIIENVGDPADSLVWLRALKPRRTLFRECKY